MSRISGEQTGAQDGTVELTESDRYRLLANETRRAVLAVLAKRSRPADLEEVAEAVVARADDEDTETTTSRLQTRLHHCHLPTMDDLGVIDYDPSANRITAWQSSTERLL